MEAGSPRGGGGGGDGRRTAGLGRCRVAFWLALLFDGAGFAALLGGVFADFFFADLLIYGGGVGIFFSLLWWVFWYVGNLEVPPGELQDDVGLGRGGGKAGGRRGGGGRQLARRLARTLSVRLSGTFARLPRAGGGGAAGAGGRPDARLPAGGRGEDGDDHRRRAAAAAATTTPEEQEREGGDLVESCLEQS